MSSLIDPSNLERFQLWLADFPYDRKQVALVATASTFAYISYKAIDMLVIKPYLSVLRDLPGPEKLDSYFLGHSSKILRSPAAVVHEEWVAQYGPTLQFRGMGLVSLDVLMLVHENNVRLNGLSSTQSRRLFTLDPKAISHIINHSYDYPKPPATRDRLADLLGNGVHVHHYMTQVFADTALSVTFFKGVLVAEGDQHRKQRKIMNPCFGITQIRELMPIFYAKSFQLRDMWLNSISEESGEAEVDAVQGLSRTTLDVIGLAGFNYEFNALVEGETNELGRAFNELLTPPTTLAIFPLLQSQYPWLKLIPTERGRMTKRNKAVMDRVGRKLVEEKKAALLQKKNDGVQLQSKNVAGRDLLSVLIKANMASDIMDSEKMTDEEMMGQITTMLLAGHETTSSSVTWLLYDLAKPENKPIQDRLRAELSTLSPEEPSMEELNALPYLDAVIRENLRINTVVIGVPREAARDDVIPLSIPIVDRKGVTRNEVRIGKGDILFVSILAMNRDKTVWGEDAETFNPERWFNPKTHPRSSEVPSVYSGIMTFLGGPRHCIGYRFALMEMKALVYALIQNMEFSLPNPTPVVKPRSAVVSRPVIILPDGTKKSYMPLIVKAVGGGD
ncbi:hypothetical protein FRB96_007127 [Tulasnella sp. 330]|nr:hypothetical protein FRB96_007127 [Tulasnella sp. 330]KAG8876430.1 hypothetical protein FRB97_004167 [Tulasnella sp. 331]KAG8881888.1 hypothetical protein FRB98_004081 [Tulasnella sp. 332]